MARKKIKFSADDSFKTWTYTYPSYQNGNDGTATVQGPEYTETVSYYGTGTDLYNNGWRFGLIKQKKYGSDNSMIEDYVWTYKQISNNEWIVASKNLGTIKAPLISTLTKSIVGDCSGKEEYIYDASSIKYGLPRRVNYYGNGILRYYKQFNYFFENNSVFLNNYIVSYIWKESVYSSVNSLLKETTKDYYTEQGKCGALKSIQGKRESNTTLTWDYAYSENPNTKTITITVNPPGNNSGIETYTYKYGVLAKLQKPGYVEFDRSVSQYNSTILSETNQHGAAYTFSYDNLGRIISVNMPTGFNNISASWSQNSVTIVQGAHKIIKYWDGIGRDLGYEEEGDGIKLYYRKTLDSEGRVVRENRGSINLSDQYQYGYNAAGKITQIKDPLSYVTTYTYNGNKTAIKDPLNRQTELTFSYLPGLVSSLKDTSGAIANYTYDAIGRLTQVVYNNARTQSYDYDYLDNIKKETHPETGEITYTYNAENLLSQKNFGGISINYEYNISNQLKKISSNDEIINYEYDSRGRINRIYSSKGWERNNILYNLFGSVTFTSHRVTNNCYFRPGCKSIFCYSTASINAGTRSYNQFYDPVFADVSRHKICFIKHCK